MNKISKYSALLFLLWWQVVVGSASAAIIPVDLNDFFADPSVSVAANGSMATLFEDPFFFSVLLANDPGLGDPDIIIPNVGTTLNFSYDFTEIAGEDNEFGAFVVDGATGGSIGSAFEFFTQDSSSGSIAFDLSSLTGQTLGLQFELTSLFSDVGFDSLATISNVFLQTVDVISVPEPSSLLLLFIGIIFLLIAKTIKSKQSDYNQKRVVFTY